MVISFPQRAQSAIVPTDPGPPIASRLDVLGTVALVTMTSRALPGRSPRPEDKVQRPVALPSFTAETIEQLRERGWEDFWHANPAGSQRLTQIEATGFADAVRQARAATLSTKPWSAPADKQSHVVIQTIQGAWYIAGLGGFKTDDFGAEGVWLHATQPIAGYRRPTVDRWEPEVKAIVGGYSWYDLTGDKPVRKTP